MPRGEQPTFPAAVADLCRHIEARAEPSAEIVTIIVGGIARHLSSYFSRGIKAPDIEDATQTALLKFFQAVRRGQVKCDDDRIGNYMLGIGRNAVRDERRRTRAEPLEDDIAVEDDELERVVDRLGARIDLEHAMAELARRKGHACVRVFAAYLHLAQTTGAQPSTRDVAAAADVSHTTVQNCLARVRSFFPNDAPETY